MHVRLAATPIMLLLLASGRPVDARPAVDGVMRDCEAWLKRIGTRGTISDRIRRSAQRVIADGAPLLAMKYPSGTRTLIIFHDHEYRAYCEDAWPPTSETLAHPVRTIRFHHPPQ